MRTQFYVYTLAYPQSMGGNVFYVGKGVKDRIDSHEREAAQGVYSQKCDCIRRVWEHGEQIAKSKVYETDREIDAFLYEWVLINLVYGWQNLTNISEGGNGGVIPFNTKSKVVSFTLTSALWDAVDDTLRGSLASYFHCLLMINLPDLAAIQRLSRDLPVHRKRGMYGGITRYVKLPLYVASRIESFPVMQRALVIESLIRKELGMEDRPDYQVGRPKNAATL